MSEKLIRRSLWACAGAALISLAFGIACWLRGYDALKHHPAHLGDLGNFGSFLQGTSATLFALTTAAVVLMAFLIQKRQLDVQREELEITRNEITEAKARQVLEDKENDRRRFEERFSQMLNLHNHNVSEMRFTFSDHDKTREVSGRACFEYWFKNFDSHLISEMFVNDGTGNLKFKDPQPNLQQAYLSFYKNYQGELGHYFRTLYHIIKFVKESKVEDKRTYSSLVRAQLSQYELALL